MDLTTTQEELYRDIGGLNETSDTRDPSILTQKPEVNGINNSMKDLSVTTILGQALAETFSHVEEQPIADPSTQEGTQVEQDSLPVIQALPGSSCQILIVNQPDVNDYKFRHEIDKHHLQTIKGQKIGPKGISWPEIKITEPPACPAEVWIQLVEQKDDNQNNPRPSPNVVCLKKEKKSKNFRPPNGIQVDSDGYEDGCDHKKGVIKLSIPDLAAIGGRICFNENLQLALFRTKAKDVWSYLSKRNDINQNTPDKTPRLACISIPKNQKEVKITKQEIDTTRVRLCFQVFLHIGQLYSESATYPQPLIVAPNPVCSEVIVDKHSHHQLRIDDSAPVIATDEGIDHCNILCSKIEDNDQNKLKLVFTFKNEKGEDFDIPMKIPKRNPQSSLIHHQYALKFGKIYDFDMPVYREVVKKLEKNSHAHASMCLCKDSEDSNDPAQLSNPIEVIIFPDGYKEQKGQCIGTPLRNRDLSCKYNAGKEKTQNSSGGATETVTNTERLLSSVLEMESKNMPNSISNLLQNSFIPSLTRTQNSQTSKVREFDVFQDIIASPGNPRIKRKPDGPSGLTDEITGKPKPPKGKN